MKVLGIIAEYNPFHNGHKYQIETLKKATHADYVVIAMSGNFVQRGVPALCDKYSRTKMALQNGADLVLELPAIWTTASAEFFAKGGVTLFCNLGVITHLGFGAETNRLDLLKKIAQILTEEPVFYKQSLRNYLKAGNNFPTARKLALQEFFFQENKTPIETDLLDNLLNSPNNILAMEYLKAIPKQHKQVSPFQIEITKWQLEPILIERKGAGYHEKSLDILHPSATAIRKQFLSMSTPQEHALRSAMPKETWKILTELLQTNALLEDNAISSILGYRLLCLKKEGYDKFADCSTDFSNKILKNLHTYTNFTGFCENLKSKELTHTRISRTLLHILLDIKQTDYTFATELGTIPYLRVLGFRKNSTKLLSAIKKEASVPLITKVADAASILSPNSYKLLEKDIFASEVYYQLLSQKTNMQPMNEFTQPIIIL